MKPDPKKIIDEAMQLEPSIRALIAETLLESLDVGADFDVSEPWRDQIRRRCKEIDRGTTALVSGNQVLTELRNKYG